MNNRKQTVSQLVSNFQHLSALVQHLWKCLCYSKWHEGTSGSGGGMVWGGGHVWADKLKQLKKWMYHHVATCPCCAFQRRALTFLRELAVLHYRGAVRTRNLSYVGSSWLQSPSGHGGLRSLCAKTAGLSTAEAQKTFEAMSQTHCLSKQSLNIIRTSGQILKD